jgi:hypothetical protein
MTGQYCGDNWRAFRVVADQKLLPQLNTPIKRTENQIRLSAAEKLVIQVLVLVKQVHLQHLRKSARF